ncbi:hypothetical protein QUB68_09185 [Microcoleus sp. A006_D1]
MSGFIVQLLRLTKFLGDRTLSTFRKNTAFEFITADRRTGGTPVPP